MWESDDPIDQLVHLYVDGAFNRRELFSRVAKYTGSATAAIAALSGYEELRAQAPPACPDGIKVPADAPDLIAQDIVFTSADGVRMQCHVAYLKSARDLMPGVMVIHENQGLVDHIKDVARRAARAGFVAVAPDLLSRQGGAAQFTDAMMRTAAYGRTLPLERRADLTATLAYMKALPNIVFDRIGVVGFCAGGGNVWDLIVNVTEIAAAVPFYGTPFPTLEDVARIKTPVFAIYAELDRALTQRGLPVIDAMETKQQTLGWTIYEGCGHAFHNDTGAAYNPAAACDAWARTITFFNKWLRAPRA